MAPHHHGSHDEEASVGQEDENYWTNESPYEVSVWVQEAPKNTVLCIMEVALIFSV